MITILFLACAPDLRETDPPEETDTDVTTDTDTDTAVDTDVSTLIVSIPEGPTGTTYVEVDATTPETWAYFDFASATEVTATDGWEFALMRSEVKVNGGTSGTGGVEVTRIEDVSLEAVSTVPTDGWTTDAGDVFALGDWYDYDASTHVLTAHPRVYVLRNGAGETWKLKFVDYYDEAGDSGHPSFRWAAL